VRRQITPASWNTRGQRLRALPSFRERLYAPREPLRVLSVLRSITATARQCATVLGARSRMATAPKILLDSCCLDPRLIGVDEANALQFYTSGAKLCLIDGPADKIDPNNLAEALAQPVYGVVHHPQPRCRSRRPPSAVLFTDRGVPKTPDVDRRTAVSSSHLTPRWREQDSNHRSPADMLRMRRGILTSFTVDGIPDTNQ
jgi:hypothetical protein